MVFWLHLEPVDFLATSIRDARPELDHIARRFFRTKLQNKGAETMGLFQACRSGLARTVSTKKSRNHKQRDSAKEAAESLARNAKENELLRCSSGSVRSRHWDNLTSIFSRRGEKGTNQDCAIVWEEYGCQEDMVFCGIFDGHGPWGHVVAKRVRKSMPSSLLCSWQTNLALTSPQFNLNTESDRELDVWKQSFLKTYSAIDQELKQHQRIDSFCSGTTALTMVKQGHHLMIANVGDSRAVLATTRDDGTLVPLQLTVDFKPNLPEEAERISKCKGRIFCLRDEPGVYRLWRPSGESPGLAMSRALGDHCVKDFGLISVPDVTQRNITSRDQFVILATDGVWDVLSNQEAIEIVSSTAKREKSAKRLVKCAARAWKYKRPGREVDDVSAICLFFHATTTLTCSYRG